MISLIKAKLKAYLFNSFDAFQKNKEIEKKLAIISSLKTAGSAINFGKDYTIKNPKYIAIGDNFSALDRFRIEAWDKYHGQEFAPSIVIGDNVVFNTDIHIGCIQSITIGDNCLFASRIFITDHHHGEPTAEMLKLAPLYRPLVTKGPVIIEDNVWVGAGVAIMPNVTIGKNSIIATNSVVTKNVPANSVVAGVPAKVIKNIK
jgi:acetyltransferase-like isoleucine patch superfamily enzyme